MVQVHRQGPIQYAYNKADDTLTPVDRTRHAAQSVGCPCCESKPGQPCRGDNGTWLPVLAVHIQRARNWISD